MRAETDRDIIEVTQEVDALAIAGKARAVAIVVVNDEGGLKTFIRYMPGTKLPLLAGLVLTRDQLAELIRSQP